MSDEYTLTFFREHYIESRGIPAEDQEKIREAFMGGAHTLMLMVTNALQNPSPEVGLRALTQELSEFMTIKSAEAQFKNATIH